MVIIYLTFFLAGFNLCFTQLGALKRYIITTQLLAHSTSAICSLELLSTACDCRNICWRASKVQRPGCGIAMCGDRHSCCLKLHVDALWHGHPVYMRSTCHPCYGHAGWTICSRGTMGPYGGLTADRQILSIDFKGIRCRQCLYA